MARPLPALEDRAQLGILLTLAAWGFFSFVDTGAKWVAVAGLPAVQIAFFRYVGHLVLASAFLFRERPDQIWPDEAPAVFIRAALLAAATLSNFWILSVLPLTITSAIMFSSPVIVCFLSVSLLKEKVGPWRWGAILLGFIGVLVVLQPFGTAFHPMMLMAVFNACCLAAYSLITRAIAGKVSTDMMQFWMGVVGTVPLLPLAILSWHPPASGLDWAILLALGPIAWAGHQLLTNALRYASANTLMPFTYSFLLYLTVLGWLVFNHVPEAATLLGASIIMASGLIIWWREGAR